MDNRDSDLGFAGTAGLKCPFVDYIIYKIYNKSDTDQEIRMAKEFPVIVSDHEIDLVNAEEDDIEGGENSEIGWEVDHFSEDQVFSYPYDAGGEEYGITQQLPGSEEPPYPELPEYEDPFEQGIGIGDYGVANPVGRQVIA